MLRMSGGGSCVKVAIFAAVVGLGGARWAGAQAPSQAPASGGQATPQAAPAAPAQGETAVTNVGGHWELNWQRSDKPPDNATPQGPGDRGDGGSRGGRGGRGGGGGGGMGGYGGRGGGGMRGMGRGGEGGGGQRDQASRDQMRQLLQAPRTLLIVEHPDHVSLTDENGQIEKLEPTGVKTKIERDGKPIDQLTRWDGRKLVCETSLGDGTKIVRTYEKVAEGLQLIVTTKVENSRFMRPTELKRVYDQALEDK